MLANQDKLRPLPVPALKESIEKYLKSLEPLVSQAQLDHTRKLAQDFVKSGGVGERLQEKLLQRASREKNWLDEWWLQYAYLAYPDPIPINSNWEMMFENGGKPPTKQSRQAARLLTGLRLFAPVIVDHKLEPEYMRGNTPMCMNQYTKPFTTCRFPGIPADYLETYPAADYVVVICKNRFFKLQFSGVHKSSDFEAAFDYVTDYCESRPLIQFSPGLFTSGDRHLWSTQREKLIDLHPSNRILFDTIAKSLCVFVLDDESPSSDAETAWSLLAGKYPSNRWFDKIFQIVIFKNGRCGMNGEHSPADGIAMARVADYLSGRIRPLHNSDVDPYDLTVQSSVPVSRPEELDFFLNPEILGTLQESYSAWSKFSEDLQLQFHRFEEYGSDKIKDTFKLSPDAYMQMALQVAYRKVHGKVCPVYETGQTRQYYHGRTETVRSLSSESASFTRAMLDESVPNEKKAHLLREAVSAHMRYMNDAVNAKGCDRHLLGLRVIAAQEGLSHELFSDPSFRASSTWVVSTSNMTPSAHMNGGFGPVAVGGYGVPYSFSAKTIRFTVTTMKSHRESKIDAFVSALLWALREMAAISSDALKPSPKL